MLRTFTLQSRDLTHDSSIYTYPVLLGHKCNDSMIGEITCSNNINNREDPMRPFKVYSKKHNKFVNIVLFLELISIDQIEKCSYILFAGSNSNFGATYTWSCWYDDIADRLVPYKRCNRKSLKGEDNKTCSKY